MSFQLFGGDEPFSKITDPNVHCYPAYKSLITNTTKYNTMFSDFMPLDTKEIDFYTSNQVGEYAKAYAEHFKVMSKVKLNVHVTKLDKKGSKWVVSYKQGDAAKKEEFDNVMICTGAFGFPNQPKIEGSNKFKGTYIHSGQLRNGAALLKDQRVMVIGGSYSGGEMINMALNHGAKHTYVSATQRPSEKSAWSIGRYENSRYGDKRPWDYLLNRENALVNTPDFGIMLSSWCSPLATCKPDATLQYPGDSLAVIDAELVNNGKRNGLLEFVGSVKKIGKNDVTLTDGRKLEDIDVIICATGFNPTFPFLDHIWPRKEQTKCELYNYTVSPSAKLDGIGFVLIQAAGYGLLPVAEMQARWFIHKMVSTKKATTFSKVERDHMSKVIKVKRDSLPASCRFNYIDDVPLLTDTLATDIGAQPPDYKALIASKDPAKVDLGVALAYGPYIGTQYRIQGPHPMAGAADECVGLAKRFLGNHFDEYRRGALKGEFARSGGAVSAPVKP